MKTGKLLAILPCLLLLSALGGSAWPELSVSAEAERLAMLGMVSTEPGDAAPVYAPYLTDKAPLLETEAWKKLGEVNILEPKNDAEKKVVDEALEAARADLDALVKASRKKDFDFWGKHMKVDPEKDIIAQPLPSHANFFMLSKLMVVESRRLDKAGDPAAEEWLLAVGRMGEHFSRDPYLISYMVGVALKNTAAENLAVLHDGHGKKDAADKWRLYHYILDCRRAGWRQFMATTLNSSPEEISELLLDEDLPFAFRFEILVWKHYCVEGGGVDLGTLKCMVTDTPDWVLEVEDELMKRDPLYKMFIEILKARKPRDVIGFRDWLDSP